MKFVLFMVSKVSLVTRNLHFGTVCMSNKLKKHGEKAGEGYPVTEEISSINP